MSVAQVSRRGVQLNVPTIWEIQQRLAQEFANMTDDEAYKIQMERVRQNPILEQFPDDVLLEAGFSRQVAAQKMQQLFVIQDLRKNT